MTLYRCTQFYGNTTVEHTDPPLAVLHNVMYLPNQTALYDHGKKVITASAYFRGPKPELMGPYTVDQFLHEVEEEAPDDEYFFLGPVHEHYGHFLVSTLTRLWAYNRERHGHLKLITYNDPADSATRHPHIALLLGLFGISLDDLVVFDRPVRLRKVIVPSPCFEEQNFAHDAFVRMCSQMQAKLLQGTTPAPSHDPVYLARYKLKKGVHTLQHEEEFANVLADHGVAMAFPEQLDLAQQVRLFTDRKNICGIGGSAFHTAAFAPPRRLLILNFANTPISSQTIIDRACGHDAIYLYSPDGIEHMPTSADFITGFRMTDPKRTADEFLRILDPFMRITPMTRRQELAAFGAADDGNSDGMSRRNIALNRPTRQSSVGTFSKGLSRTEDSAGAVSGFCTGSYQFHTDGEPSPWWEVDLGSGATVEEVRLFNRLDPGQDRANSFALLVSNDGQTWTELLQHVSETPFGGLDGHPFIYTPPTPFETRFVRITLLTPNFLHLDQVVVYGKTPPTG